MRLTINILSGARAGQRILLGPGESLRVGRTPKADIAIADDPTMSGVHYQIESAEGGATIRDLGSRNGVFVNGAQVSEVAVRDGDQVRAGRTFFSISIDAVAATSESARTALPSDETRAPGPGDATRAALPAAGTMYFAGDPSQFRHEIAQEAAIHTGMGLPAEGVAGDAPAPTAPPADDATLDGSADYLALQRGEQAIHPGRLYAVVDGAIAQALVQEAKRGHLRVECLLASGSSPYLAAVAPYLIEVVLDSAFLATWRTMLSKSPGILVESQADFDEVLTHAQSTFSRKDERGKPSFFRFYDPKLLYAWLSSCTAPQLASFFGCLSGVIVGVDSGNRLLRLTRRGDELAAEEIFA